MRPDASTIGCKFSLCRTSCQLVLLLREHTLQDLFKHLPFVLIVFLVVIMGTTDQAVGAESRVYVTLLAPILWLGLYLLFCTDRVAGKE